jgi:hypothetical protein
MTTRDVAERLVIVVPDSVVNPDTFRLFRIVPAERVRSPLIVAAFETFRNESTAVAFPADTDDPATMRLF